MRQSSQKSPNFPKKSHKISVQIYKYYTSFKKNFEPIKSTKNTTSNSTFYVVEGKSEAGFKVRFSNSIYTQRWSKLRWILESLLKNPLHFHVDVTLSSILDVLSRTKFEFLMNSIGY